MPSCVMLKSLFKHSTSPIKVYLLYSDLSKKNRALIQKIIECTGNEYCEIAIDRDLFSSASLNNNSMYSIEIYYRIMLPYLVDVSKILWMDSDIVLNGKIEELYSTDVSSVYVAATIDIGEEQGRRTEIKSKLGITGTYFNSGVMLMNLEKIRSEIPQKFFFDMIQKYNDDLVCPDQDILNLVLGSKMIDLDIRFNFQHHTIPGVKAEDGLCIHYVFEKPWNISYYGFLGDLFWREAKDAGYLKKFIIYKIKRKLLICKEEYIPAVMRKIKKLKM